MRCVCFSLTFILSGGDGDDGGQCSQQQRVGQQGHVPSSSVTSPAVATAVRERGDWSVAFYTL